MTTSTTTRYYVKTVDTGCYLISAGYGSAKWGEFDEATEFHTAEEAANAQKIAGRFEEEALQLVAMTSTPTTNREIAIDFLRRFGTPVETDIVTLEALLVMAEEEGQARAEWASHEPTAVSPTAAFGSQPSYDQS